jgi:hypothetical protein
MLKGSKPLRHDALATEPAHFPEHDRTVRLCKSLKYLLHDGLTSLEGA